MNGYPETHQTVVNLMGVKPELCAVVRRALALTPIGFSVIQGLRTVQEQTADLAAGKSKTMKSRHLTGQAVDFCAMVNGKSNWSPCNYYPIVLAFKQASTELNIPLTWGGVWDLRIDQLGTDVGAEVQAYHAREAAKGNHHPLADLDHVELERHTYP